MYYHGHTKYKGHTSRWWMFCPPVASTVESFIWRFTVPNVYYICCNHGHTKVTKVTHSGGGHPALQWQARLDQAGVFEGGERVTGVRLEGVAADPEVREVQEEEVGTERCGEYSETSGECVEGTGRCL